MILLLAASFIWAFSFGLVKKYLAGLDAGFVAFARLALAALVFFPLLRPRRVPSRLAWRLFLSGMVQFGLMYVFYIQSFRFLAAHQVALFTIFTPVFVALADDLWQKRFRPVHLWTALLAVLGTALIVYSGVGENGVLSGFLLVQASNICFALGQVFYRRLRPANVPWRDREGFAWLYAGGAVAALAAMAIFSGPPHLRLSAGQILVLLYLGLLASGVGFFLWNVGATRVSAGTLAVFNNVKIPLAVLVSLLVFAEQAHGPRLLGGGAIIALAVWLNVRPGQAGPTPLKTGWRQGADRAGPER
jgi:carboxylate/amino acid/amine transporter